MHPFTRFGTSRSLSLWLVLVMGCSKKGPECQALIDSMNDLGTRLVETQKVTSHNDAKPEEVALALRPFASTAKSTGEKLASKSPSIAELRRIANDASRASLALSANATNMAEAAEQMKGLDASAKKVEELKKTVDLAEAEIKKICDGNPTTCTGLAKVLLAFPSPPDKTDNQQALSTWSTKLNAWATELSRVDVSDPALKGHVAVFVKGWQDFASAMTTLVGISEMAKRYDEFAKTFNAQIDLANKAIAEANSFCKN